GLESPAIAHNELAASAGFVTFDVSEREFPRNRSPPRWKFVCRPQKNLRSWRSARFQRRPRRSPLPSKAIALWTPLHEPVLPLEERRMQSAVGWSGRGMLCDLGVLGAVSGDH